MARASHARTAREVWGHSPPENLENLDSQECVFLHSGKEIILLSSLLVYPVYNKKIHCALQKLFVYSSTVVNNKDSNEEKIV